MADLDDLLARVDEGRWVTWGEDDVFVFRAARWYWAESATRGGRSPLTSQLREAA
jgi:hypothetical protein